VLLAKLEVFDEEVAARIRLGARYGELLREAFADAPGTISTPYVEPFKRLRLRAVHHRGAGPRGFEARMKSLGVPTAVHYPSPLHLQPALAHLGLREGLYPAAEAAARRVISLPMHPYLAEADQVRVAQAVRQAVG